MESLNLRGVKGPRGKGEAVGPSPSLESLLGDHITRTPSKGVLGLVELKSCRIRQGKINPLLVEFPEESKCTSNQPYTSLRPYSRMEKTSINTFVLLYRYQPPSPGFPLSSPVTDNFVVLWTSVTPLDPSVLSPEVLHTRRS